MKNSGRRRFPDNLWRWRDFYHLRLTAFSFFVLRAVRIIFSRFRQSCQGKKKPPVRAVFFKAEISGDAVWLRGV